MLFHEIEYQFLKIQDFIMTRLDITNNMNNDQGTSQSKTRGETPSTTN